MTKEEKELLLKDLCSRLPYDVKVHTNGNNNIRTVKGIDLIVTDEGEWEYAITSNDSTPIELKYIKPYLRPLLNMTEEEKKELSGKYNWGIRGNQIWIRYHSEGYWDDETECPTEEYLNLFDWFNAHHFDYRDLIEKGLALEAPEGMYKF